ncbi:hypothetical protein ES288_D13G138400v1 [Gossypium darwinii]|uniref:Uncharacterized protein n=1 Tax=Gossypium darwinii TaxID=34276 RepID=A0A5D1ZXT2_GOSDA|nr:hypothetical protein ES288_D13G138400v1 [Gossypium darwinii]
MVCYEIFIEPLISSQILQWQAAKKHLNQRIQNLDGKMETQKEILKSIQTTEVKTYYNGCLGAICGCGLVKAFQKTYYNDYGGGANELQSGFNKGTGLGAEIIGTFVLVYTVFSTTDPKRNARDSHVPVLAPLPVEFAVVMVHLATIPVNETGINLARSFRAAVIYTKVEVDQNTHHAKLVNIPGSYTKSVE